MGSKTKHSVSIIVPVRDESGTIAALTKQTPVQGRFTELIFVEGYSNDDSWDKIGFAQKLAKNGLKIKGFQFRGKKGKAAAVWKGIGKAKGDIVMILDADLSVAPNELKKFYKVLLTSKCRFVNGSRFLLPREKGAMRLFNHLGNRFFAFCFSLLLKQKITDTLCGTKAFYREDYLKMRKKLDPRIFDEDPFGDFSLLFGARELALSIAEVPVNYKARIYGKSKISPFKDGIKLIIILLKDLVRFSLKHN